jgi:hypothetical protein
MRNGIVTTAAAAVLLAGALSSPVYASGKGGGGGGTKEVLPTPAIPAGTVEGIGPGPTYIHESFGFAQRTRYKQSGDIIDVVDKPEINGIRAEFPNNKTETWIGGRSEPNWRFSSTSTNLLGEPVTPLQENLFGTQNGTISIVGAEVATDTRPAAVLPFAAPSDSAYTVSADMVTFIAKTALGFSSSSAVNRNFETGGEVWLEVDTYPLSYLGGNTGVPLWTFHAGATTLTGSFDQSFLGWERLTVSYDPVARAASASINGNVVASVPYTASSVRYVGVEGSLHATVDNLTVHAGS